MNDIHFEEVNPEDFNLPSDYSFAVNSWGNSFHKIYNELGKKTYLEAKKLCEDDNATLANPRFETENAFIAGLTPERFWIGINDIENEGEFVSLDGNPVSFTKWKTPREPSNSQHGDFDEDAVVLNFYDQGFWNDWPIDDLLRSAQVVCFYQIQRESFIHKMSKFHCGPKMSEN